MASDEQRMLTVTRSIAEKLNYFTTHKSDVSQPLGSEEAKKGKLEATFLGIKQGKHDTTLRGTAHADTLFRISDMYLQHIYSCTFSKICITSVLHKIGTIINLLVDRHFH